MTISAAYVPDNYTGNGVTTAFPVTFPFFGTLTLAELKVVQVTIADNSETTLVNGTHYTVSGGEGSTGTVTAVTAPASLYKWVIRRVTIQLQEEDYIENDDFPAAVHEGALDRGMAILQEHEEDLGRTAQITEGDTSGFDPTIPLPVAGSLVGIASDGLSFVLYVPVDLSLETVTAFAATLLDDADADTHWATLMTSINKATARTGLGVAIGSDVQAYDAAIVKTDEAATFTKGHKHTVYDNGNSGTSTHTLDVDNGLQQKMTCTGSFTLAASSSGDGFFMEFLLTMDGTGGYTVTFSGFEKTINGAIDNTASAKNLIRITRIDSNDAVEIVQL